MKKLKENKLSGKDMDADEGEEKISDEAKESLNTLLNNVPIQGYGIHKSNFV